MKKFKYIYILLLFSVSSCQKDILDKKPLDVISDAIVWEDEKLIEAYLTQAYLQMYILMNETPNSLAKDFASSDDWNGPFIINELADEGTRNWIFGQSEVKKNGLTINGGVLEWWENSYEVIRTLNELILKVPNAPLEDDFIKKRVAEARFLRAYNYFAMVKRYGGVPLITIPQDINASPEELFPTRNTEQEVYDFILSELDQIKDDLAPRAETDYGRPSKGVVLALKSRAALYAGSIAKFGEVQINGVVGINTSLASSYYQKSYDAARELIESGEYNLYESDNDKTLNFQNVFLKKNNVEVIWAQRHDYVLRSAGGNGWIWDFFQSPKPHPWGAGNQNAPYLEMAEEFEYVDGSSGTFNRLDLQQKLWTTEDLWKNKDPRFFATLYTQNTNWKGTPVNFQNGLILPDGSIMKGGSYMNVPTEGDQKVDNSFGTGFGVLKYLDPSHDIMTGDRGTSGTDFQLFRYAEILLNYAEAAFELGRSPDALLAVNEVRERAGIAKLNSVDREKIRHERKVELAFEGHRYWDLRRWRIATSLLTVNRSGLQYILDYNSRKYKLIVLENYDSGISDPIFYNYNNYFPITRARTANNPNLVENPGYF
ncbi:MULTISPECIES: RagB/SusD family nutrient uptake outer membrane protein [Sphingobacterium]|uniref:RagB/SusD family nutrient uptake outer membrane protein n=1 Tax=Sphingobacterium TaxID=28453 RepID=UPI00162799F4|nr:MULTISPECIES: RagB/SusD family nutrient uptake outer membrane protein [Sphingobacterium]